MLTTLAGSKRNQHSRGEGGRLGLQLPLCWPSSKSLRPTSGAWLSWLVLVAERDTLTCAVVNIVLV